MLSLTILLLLWLFPTQLQAGHGYTACGSNGGMMDYSEVVSQILDEDEVFIQFRDVLTLYGASASMVSDGNFESQYEYVAVVVDPCEESSYVVYLFGTNQLHEYERKDATNIDLSNLVWGQLSDVIKGKKSIYFSIAGELYNYPIEYLPYGEERVPMNDVFNMYRVSDIEQLGIQANHGNGSIDKAVVFGGLTFELGQKELADTATILSFRDRTTNAVSELPNTHTEALFVDSLLRANHVKVALQEGENGTLQAFGNITASEANLLHLATHGFYKPNEHRSTDNELKPLMLKRVGLYLSGDVPNDPEGCTIRGAQVADMALDSMDFVVLSACQTGLGDVFEGKQYGLSEAFRTAGAKTLLASLWSVHDEATRLLMEQFYTHVVNGTPPNKALSQAQHYVKSYNNGVYNSPAYWASFVLIDGFARKAHPFTNEVAEFIQTFKDDNVLGSIVENDRRHWDSYQHLLGEDDALIYFYNYTLAYGEDEYVALILTPASDDGKIIPIIRSTAKISESDWWQAASEEVYNNLIPHIKGKRNVYFRPTGIFTTVPLENYWEWLHEDDGIAYYRLSSGESLRLLEEKEDTISSAVLYGGIDYSDTHMPWQLSSKKSITLSYLPGTEKETIEAESVMTANEAATLRLSGTEASAVTFRLLDGAQCNLLHYAGHAANFTLKDLFRLNGKSAVPPVRYHSVTELLYGCSWIIFASTDKHDAYNPVISANDIVKMDLRGMDLTILSSLKSLYSSSTSCLDFGFARAFKTAGASSILGTVSIVDDEATAILISKFIENMGSEKDGHPSDKREALLSAQHYLREEYERYEDPQWWASFVLIDGIGTSKIGNSDKGESTINELVKRIESIGSSEPEESLR